MTLAPFAARMAEKIGLCAKAVNTGSTVDVLDTARRTTGFWRGQKMLFFFATDVFQQPRKICVKIISLSEELFELKTSVEEAKAAIGALSQPSAPNPEAMYSSAVNSVKFLKEYETEIRFSGLPEYKIEKDLNSSRSKSH